MAIREQQTVFEYDGVGRSFWAKGREFVALRDVTFSVRLNEFTAVLGPSGCGKSTLLRLCAGLDRPTTGVVRYRGKPVDALNTEVGFVTQESNLYPWLTLRQNVQFALDLRGVGPKECRERTDASIGAVGLSGFEDHYPYQLSGGMQKRAAIIRTMIYEPAVILMDEPFGALDAQTRMVLHDDFLRVWSERQQTVLFITHDLNEAIALSDTIVVMSARPGTVKAVFPVGLTRPRDVYQIHRQAGFTETYNAVWECLRSELRGAEESARRELVLGAPRERDDAARRG